MATAAKNQREGLTEPTKKEAGDSWLITAYWDPDFKDEVLRELDRLASLPKNWDSYGAPRIRPDIITAAKEFVLALPENIAYRPRVVPMSPGNLQFEWHHGAKVLELEFESPETIRYLQWYPGQGEEEEAAFPASDIEKAVDLIQWFMSGTTCE